MVFKNVHGKTDFTNEAFTFFVQTDNEKVVTVIMRDKETNKGYWGQAVCHDADKFDPWAGVELAIKRALEAYDNGEFSFGDDNDSEDKDEEEGEDDTLRIGDKVRITNSGDVYTTYNEWVEKNIRFDNYWKYGYGDEEGEAAEITKNVYTLVAIAPHKYEELGMVGFVCSNEKKVALAVTMDTLEKVKE